MAQINKHARGAYSIDGVHYTGRRDDQGKLFVPPGYCSLVFAIPGDLPGVNLDPCDVLSVLADHVKGTAAEKHIIAAAEELGGSGEFPESADKVVKPINKGGRPRKKPVAA